MPGVLVLDEQGRLEGNGFLVGHCLCPPTLHPAMFSPRNRLSGHHAQASGNPRMASRISGQMLDWRIFGFASTSDFDQFASSRINHLCLNVVRHLYKIITKIDFVVDNVIANNDVITNDVIADDVIADDVIADDVIADDVIAYDIADVDVVDVVVAGLMGAVTLPLVNDAVPLVVRYVVVVSEHRAKCQVSQCRK